MYKTADNKGRFQYPSNWDSIVKEIDQMFIDVDSGYLDATFITISFYTIPLETNPENYPLLTINSKSTQNRYIAMFLRDKGWIRHSVHSFMNPKKSQQIEGERNMENTPALTKGRVIAHCANCGMQFSVLKSEYLARLKKSTSGNLFHNMRCMRDYGRKRRGLAVSRVCSRSTRQW